MRRLPIRVRVAAAFAVAMAIVLAGTGLFVYARLSDSLGAALDQQLQLRAQDLSQLMRDPRGSLSTERAARFVESGESFAQLLGADGRVLDATAGLGARPLLDEGQRSAALRAPLYARLPRLPNLDEGVRLLATLVQRAGNRAILVVGATAENRGETLASLRDELLIAGPVALLLATVLGYMLAGLSLRAVDVMRSRAAQISADRPGERLPVPATGDELERLGTSLNEMLARLHDSLRREREFVAEAGHELRTPLALMRAELDYALRYAVGEDELRSALRTASDETDRLVALAGALLLMASSDRGHLRLRVETVAVEELLASVSHRFAWRADQLGRSLQTECEDGLTLRCDRLRLEQALGNLVDNALRHGGGDVCLAARTEQDRVVLTVADTGGGFDPGFLPHAFQRFRRGEGATRAEGSGLGLAIVQAIAQAHHGNAAAENGERGAAVSIRLSRRSDAAPHATQAAPSRSAS